MAVFKATRCRRAAKQRLEGGGVQRAAQSDAERPHVFFELADFGRARQREQVGTLVVEVFEDIVRVSAAIWLVLRAHRV